MCALHLDEARYFHFNYINLFSKALGYDRNDCSCVRMTSDCLKNCTRMDPEQARLLKILFEENSMDAVTLQKKWKLFRGVFFKFYGIWCFFQTITMQPTWLPNVLAWNVLVNAWANFFVDLVVPTQKNIWNKKFGNFWVDGGCFCCIRKFCFHI